MRTRRLFVGFALVVAFFPHTIFAQFTEAHNYDNTPVGVNQIEVGYTYVRTNASIDPSLVIADAKFNLNAASFSYTRYFGLANHLAWFEASVPVASLSGSVNGTNIHGSTTGAGDASFTFSMLLKGGRTLSVKQFAEYKPVTSSGISLNINAPTGQYDGSKLLNLGADRWSFKPEFALSHPFGPDKSWQLDTYANVSFFTDNTSYRGKETLRQEPLGGVEGHMSYSFTENVWASVDSRYSFRGATAIDGQDQYNAQQNFTLGGEVNVSLSQRNSLAFEFAKALVHQNGPALKGFAIKYNYSWGRGF
jgi:hypothetical protein